MTAIPRARLVAALALCSATTLAAGAAAPAHVVVLHDGLNRVDITGHGDPAVALLAHRENYNAHSFDVMSLYLTPARGAAGAWQAVPLFTRDDSKLSLDISGGADCVLDDFRLLSAKGQPMRLVTASRDFGDNFAAIAPVHFSFYALKRNLDGSAGWPDVYFELEKTSTAKRPYCDVDEALKSELGLGPGVVAR